jgi:hypothetical protein
MAISAIQFMEILLRSLFTKARKVSLLLAKGENCTVALIVVVSTKLTWYGSGGDILASKKYNILQISVSYNEEIFLANCK